MNGIIEQVKAYAELHGVSIGIELNSWGIDNHDVFHVDYLERKDREDPTSKGHGMKTLLLLCLMADQVGADVEIEYMTDEPRLDELYSSLGFEVYVVGEEITSMRRCPQPVSNVADLITEVING